MRTMTAPGRVSSAPVLNRSHALELRREALQALDQSVLTLIGRRMPAGRFGTPAAIGLTIYDQLYPALGGHWTVAYRRPMGFMHSVATLTIALEFDKAQRPARFRLTGAATVRSRDASLEALDEAIEQVLAAGLLVTSAPSFMPGFAL